MKNAAFIFLVLLSSRCLSAQIETINVGNWFGGAYTDDKTGSFLSCVVGTTFANKTMLNIYLYASGVIGIGISQDDAKFPTGIAINGNIKVDDRYFNVFSTQTSDPTAFYIVYDASNPLFEALRKGRLLTITSDVGVYYYDLSDTANALARVKSCVQKHTNTQSNVESLTSPNASALKSTPNDPSIDNSTVDRRDGRKEESRHLEHSASNEIRGDGSIEDLTCSGYGFKPGTDPYADCRMKLEMARVENERRTREYEAQRQQYEQQLAAIREAEQREAADRRSRCYMASGAAAMQGATSLLGTMINASACESGAAGPVLVAPPAPPLPTVVRCSAWGNTVTCVE